MFLFKVKDRFKAEEEIKAEGLTSSGKEEAKAALSTEKLYLLFVVTCFAI